jgi:hypothetical protein
MLELSVPLIRCAHTQFWVCTIPSIALYYSNFLGPYLMCSKSLFCENLESKGQMEASSLLEIYPESHSVQVIKVHP